MQRKKGSPVVINEHCSQSINQSINQSKHISIAPYVASESEAHETELILVTLVIISSTRLPLRWAFLDFTALKLFVSNRKGIRD